MRRRRAADHLQSRASYCALFTLVGSLWVAGLCVKSGFSMRTTYRSHSKRLIGSVAGHAIAKVQTRFDARRRRCSTGFNVARERAGSQAPPTQPRLRFAQKLVTRLDPHPPPIVLMVWGWLVGLPATGRAVLRAGQGRGSERKAAHEAKRRKRSGREHDGQNALKRTASSAAEITWMVTQRYLVELDGTRLLPGPDNGERIAPNMRALGRAPAGRARPIDAVSSRTIIVTISTFGPLRPLGRRPSFGRLRAAVKSLSRRGFAARLTAIEEGDERRSAHRRARDSCGARRPG